MGAPPVPGSSSLDRLKALDALPNLDSQLQEAKQLCDHRARAEMILKWLMAKLKTSHEARQNDGCWSLLASTVRLLPPQRIAVLSSGLPPALQQTWATSELSDATVFAIARLFTVLLGLAQSVDGAAIKSLLSVKGDTAATMCGDWYRHVQHNFSSNEKVVSLVNDSLLDPALQLWHLRAQMDSDDSSFNNHCLRSILLLLTQLRNANTPNSAKRKRGQPVAITVTPTRYAHALEALIARHTVLPARIVFNRKLEQQPRRTYGHRPTKQPTINERLSTLKEAISTGESGATLVDSISLVLDVALRSVSTPTPRDRLAERPWIETLLTALSDCASNQSRAIVNRALIELLEVVRQNGLARTGLSAQMLTGLMKHHAIVDDSSEESIDWRLVAKIVQLEPDVLTNPAITENLFRAISDVDDHRPNPLATVWRDDIVVPTMKAFAQARSLAAFVEIWHKQLLHTRDSKHSSVWESLSMPFAAILEDQMLPEQIATQIDRFLLPVNAVVEEQSKLSHEDVASALGGNIILLEALLRGTRSDDLVLSLQDKLDRLLHTAINVANLRGFKSTISTSSHYWSLLMRAFQLWFPLWASKQGGNDIVEREGMAILSSKAFKYALTQCSASGIDPPRHHAETVRAARGFIASLCACFQQYGDAEGCAGRCADAMEQVVKHELGVASVLAHRQILHSPLNTATQNGLIALPQLLAATDEHNEPIPIQALLASTHGTGEQQTVEDVVSIVLESLTRKESLTSAADEELLVSTLTNIDPHSIGQTERVRMIDTISQLPEVHADERGNARLQARFALLLKLLDFPCQNAQLLTDPIKLWDLASLVRYGVNSGPASSSPSPDSFETAQLLECVVRCVLSSLLATQDREKSQKALEHFSRLIKDSIKLGAKGARLSAHGGQLAFIKVAITMLEASAKDDIKSHLAHRTSKTARSYLDTLMAECSSTSDQKGGKITTAQAMAVVLALQAMLDVPDALMALSEADRADYSKQLYKLARGFMSFKIKGEETLQSKLLVVCFQLICKHASSKKNLTIVAEEVLERDLKAIDLVTVTQAYEAAFTQANAEWKLAAITALTTDSSSPLLQQTALKALTKEDAEDIPSSKGLVLHALSAAKSPDSRLAARRVALQSLALVFKDKPFLVSQHTIEQALTALQELLSSEIASEVGVLYLNICSVLTVVFASHRSRLQGRFHLLIGILQQLISHLFRDDKAGVPQARSLAKLLESFCNPPALRYRKGGKPSELVDEAKRAQAHAGQFAQYLLHSYCGCVLIGSLGQGVREALLPGLWAVIEAMEAYNEDAVRVLSSAATNSERAVLRSVYEEWKRFGKWEGV